MKNTTVNIIYILCIIGFYLGSQGCALNFDTDGSTLGIIEKSGELTENEVWSGRIYVTSTVIVPEGVTLTIRAGTIVGFEPADNPSELIVHGELYAEGAPDRMIVFGSLGKQSEAKTETNLQNATSQTFTRDMLKQQFTMPTDSSTQATTAAPPKAGDWQGIKIETGSPNSRLTYCRIQHATYAIICETDTVQIERCLFSENKIGVLCENTNPAITANEFNRNGTGAQFRGAAAPEVEYNEFNANRNGLVCEDDSRPRIQHNNIRSNYEYAIICYSTSSPEIVSNNITLNSGWAVYDGGRLRDNYISGNKLVGPNVTELSIGTQSEQFYGVDEVFDPRNSPVSEAGVPSDNF
ncbi:MAG: right-handed parallel beta-helix repeat-containing protein [Candidatus Poribacteria bacterium]|nr:right-handed parallel beta-helix repeat-containing protein [Candidatus Poribacteria bacterium]